jgi:hypothetical protein
MKFIVVLYLEIGKEEENLTNENGSLVTYDHEMRMDRSQLCARRLWIGVIATHEGGELMKQLYENITF